jgi:ATP/maltotriose-dependent transcriptional regulator MalT
MPKAAEYTLAWSVERQAYVLSDHQTKLDLALDGDSTTWQAWLKQATSFAFRGQGGSYTARRERVKKGGWYWYAYRRSQKRVRKQYLGKSDALSLQRLEEIAERFNDELTIENESTTDTLLEVSRLYREQDMLAEVIARAHAAGDWERIATIIEEVGMELMSCGETEMVMSWVAMLPRHLVFSRLRLFLFECWYRWYSGYSAVVVEMFREYTRQHALPGLEIEDIATLEQAISAHVDTFYPLSSWSAEQRTNRIAEALVLYGVLTMRRPDGAAFSQDVCRSAAAYVAGLPHRARIVQHLGTICILRGNLTEAAAVLEDALASAIADNSSTWIANIGYRLGMLYEMLGQWHKVTRMAWEILQTTANVFLAKGTAYIFLGSVEYEQNNLETAERYFKLAIASCEEIDPLKNVDPYMHLLLSHLRLARIQFIRKDMAGARQRLEEIAGYLSRNWVGVEVFPVVKGEYTLLMHELGDESAGRQWLEAFPPPERSEQLLLRQFISLNLSHPLVFVKMLLVYQRWQEAEQLAQEQQGLAERQGRTGSLIQWLTLLALLKQSLGDAGQALFAITRALSLAEPRGYIRLFLDAGSPLLTLLYRLRHERRTQPESQEQAPTPGYLDRLILLFKQEQQAGLATGDEAEFSLVDPLSEREREVLWHISEGHSNRKIAEQLVIAPSTVKSHIKAIYAKLGVESRTQALIQARRLKLF